jgi:hypothetical protein
LQSICTSPLLDQDLVDAARQLISSAMDLSAFTRERVLAAYLDLSSNLRKVALAIGPSPSLRTNGSANDWKGTFSDSVMQTKQKISSFLITICILIFINYLTI